MNDGKIQVVMEHGVKHMTSEESVDVMQMFQMMLRMDDDDSKN